MVRYFSTELIKETKVNFLLCRKRDVVNSVPDDFAESCQLIEILWSSLRKEEDKPLSLSGATRTTRALQGSSSSV